MIVQRYIQNVALPLALLTGVANSDSTANAGMALFTRDTDTILVPGHIFVSDTLTMEAYVKFDMTGPAWGGDIFHEQYWGACDNAFEAGSDGSLYAWTYPNNGDIRSLNLNIVNALWHHVAYVRQAGNQRLYLDGTLIGNKSGAGSSIGNSGSSWMSVGSFQYTFYGIEGWHRSFIGALDWLRVSSNARYTGDTYTIPTEPASDANTLLLYNFNDAPGSATIRDLSANQWDGQMGVGHFGAYATPTPPTLVSESSITSQPKDVVVSSGQSASFQVSVVDPLRVGFQWQFNGTNISGATNASYSIPAATAANIGFYSVAVSGQTETNYSSAASLAVQDLKMLAAIYLAGPLGKTYRIDATSAVGPTNWTALTNVTITAQPFIYVDYASETNRTQFYRSVPLP